jgi:hypothetical protein
MKKVYKKAVAARTKAETEEVLKKNGFHKVSVCFVLTVLISYNIFFENVFWSISNSDPYQASSYGLLHAYDLGKWGKHLFVPLKEVLGDMKKKGEYSQKYVCCSILISETFQTHYTFSMDKYLDGLV